MRGQTKNPWHHVLFVSTSRDSGLVDSKKVLTKGVSDDAGSDRVRRDEVL